MTASQWSGEKLPAGTPAMPNPRLAQPTSDSNEPGAQPMDAEILVPKTMWGIPAPLPVSGAAAGEDRDRAHGDERDADDGQRPQAALPA
jgi:hypothetical protein